MAIIMTKGTIAMKGEVKSGRSQNGRDWSRQDILIEIPGYQGSTTKLSLTASNEIVDELRFFNVGDKVEIGWAIYAREWNGRWFNNCDIVKVNAEGTIQAASRAAAPAPAPASAPLTAEQDNQEQDLPF